MPQDAAAVHLRVPVPASLSCRFAATPLDIPWRCVAATPRPRRGNLVETGARLRYPAKTTEAYEAWSKGYHEPYPNFHHPFNFLFPLLMLCCVFLPVLWMDSDPQNPCRAKAFATFDRDGILTPAETVERYLQLFVQGAFAFAFNGWALLRPVFTACRPWLHGPLNIWYSAVRLIHRRVAATPRLRRG